MAVNKQPSANTLIILQALIMGTFAALIYILLEFFWPDAGPAIFSLGLTLACLIMSFFLSKLSQSGLVSSSAIRSSPIIETPKSETKTKTNIKSAITNQSTSTKEETEAPSESIALTAANEEKTVVVDQVEVKKFDVTPWQPFDKSPIGIILLGIDGKTLYANEIGQKSVKPDGQITLQLDDGKDLNEWIKQARNKVTDYNLWQRVADTDVATEDRQFYDVAVNFRQGEEVETMIVMINRTADYSVEEEDFDFIAFATHELRGPITVIRGYLEILEQELKPAISGDHQQIFDRLIVSSNRLSTYINNILSVSKYDRKHLQVFIHEETVSDIIDSIVDDLKLRASTQQRLLTFELEDDLPTVAADKSSVGEVIVNLVDNAIKYSHEGGSIIVNAVSKGEFVEISVTDYGIGMPSNVVNNLFKKFYRSHRSRQAVAGTGIGLYLSKAIIDSHGGYISVKSEVGEGSVFTFGIPVYNSVADKIEKGDGKNKELIRQQHEGWIKNHGLYKN